MFCDTKALVLFHFSKHHQEQLQQANKNQDRITKSPKMEDLGTVFLLCHLQSPGDADISISQLREFSHGEVE